MLSSWPFTDRATLSRGKASTVAAGFRLSQQFDGLAHVVGLACLQGMLSPGARQCTFEERAERFVGLLPGGGGRPLFVDILQWELGLDQKQKVVVRGQERCAAIYVFLASNVENRPKVVKMAVFRQSKAY